MEDTERKEIVRQLLKQGKTLSEIQDYLIKEKGDSITYMELRLLLSDMSDVQLPSEPSTKFVEPPGARAAARPTTPPASPTASPNKQTADTPQASQKTVVEVDEVVRPGAAVSGRVSFSSGAKARWYLDAYGRIGIIPEPGSRKPTAQDTREFQLELERILSEATGGF